MSSTQYEAAGAHAISVLTDEQFFKGSVDDLRAAVPRLDDDDFDRLQELIDAMARHAEKGEVGEGKSLLDETTRLHQALAGRQW